jgi:PDZ domain/PEGA domain
MSLPGCTTGSYAYEPMSPKSIVCLVALLLVAGKIKANDHPANCAVYFSVVENDEASVHRSILKMNEPQSTWYEKYGNRDKYAGICYVENGARVPVDEPLYVIVWGEHPASEPYAYSYEATAAARGDVGNTTGQNSKANTVSGIHTMSNSETKKHSVADGWLAVWNIATSENQGRFVPVGPLRSRGRGDLNSASASLLKDAIEQISQREKERLASIGKGWAVVSIKPIENSKPTASENPPTTSQNSSDTVQPVVSPAGQTAALKTSPAESSAIISAVRVTSTVPGAEIFVDGEFVGNTPSTIDVTAGKHVITVKKPGLADWVRTVNFSGGLVTLDAEFGGEAIETSAADADPPTAPDRSTVSPADQSTRSVQKPLGWIGVSTKNDGEGAVVTDVTAKGPAALAGIHVGDVILTLDGRRVNSEELQTQVAAFKPGTRVPVSYASGSSTHEVWITVASRD